MDRIIELHLQGLGRRRISKQTGISERRVRKAIADYKDGTDLKRNTRTVTYQGGTIDINDKVELSADELLSPEAIMRACNIDPTKFEIVTFQHSEWDGMAKVNDKMQTKRLYSIKLKVRPIKVQFDFDACLEKIISIEVKDIEYADNNGGLLEVFLTDSHRGLDNNYDRLLGAITERSKAMQKVVIIYGSDEFHVDSVKNTTVNGTQLEPIDLNEAWEDSYGFYFSLIYKLIQMGKEVEVIYLPGNHDSTISFSVVKALEKSLPQAKYDVSMEQYKAMRWKGVGIGWTHGDKGRKQDYDRLFLKRFPWIFGDALYSEFHYGHIHQESAKDSYGNMIRSLPTGTAQSQWTIDSGYESVQRFMLFEYDEESLKAIYYV